jgi:2-polyprenyl-6-hydroxyphenyl methylase / 3-demethylubiquinone-9 3-methyltransferase
MAHASTIDSEDVARFSAQADGWWDATGAFKPLHDITPLRIRYITEQIEAHIAVKHSGIKQLAVLDVGCGGGLVSEPLARLDAQVTGIDASEKNIAVAKAHAAASQLTINYQSTTAEALATTGVQYDVVLALEIIEHVSDVSLFLHSLVTLCKPDGVIIITTLNRTLKSFALAIIGAEYIMRWLPIGTHNWKQFLRPSEIALPMEQHGCVQRDATGMTYNPLSREWKLNAQDLEVNYLMTFQRNSK